MGVSPGLVCQSAASPDAKTFSKTGKTTLDLGLGHKVNDNRAYCSVWNRPSGLLVIFLTAWIIAGLFIEIQREVNEENLAWIHNLLDLLWR